MSHEISHDLPSIIDGPVQNGPAPSPSEVRKVLSQKDLAVRFLAEVAAHCRNAEPSHRFYTVDGMPSLLVRSSRHDDSDPRVAQQQREHAGKRLFENLNHLRGLKLSKPERDCLEYVLKHAQEGDITCADILKLQGVVQRVEGMISGERAEKNAYEKLARCVAQMRKHGQKSSLTWDGKNARVTFDSRRPWWPCGRTSRQHAGDWLAKQFEPLRGVLERNYAWKRLHNQDDLQPLIEFDRLMDLLKQGRMNVGELVDLLELVDREHAPNAYARRTIRMLAGMARETEPNKVVSWSSKHHDFSIMHRRNAWCWSRSEASYKFGRRIKGIDFNFKPTVANELKELKQDLKQVEHAINHGEIGHKHLLFMDHLLDREETPIHYALEELDRLCDIARFQPDSSRVTWDTNGMRWRFRHKALMTPTGRTEAGKRIYWRLKGLNEVIPDGSPRRARLLELLHTIKQGNATSQDFITVQQLVDEEKQAEATYLESEEVPEPSSASTQSTAPSQPTDQPTKSAEKHDRQKLILPEPKKGNATLERQKALIKSVNPEASEQFDVLCSHLLTGSASTLQVLNYQALARDAKLRALKQATAPQQGSVNGALATAASAGGRARADTGVPIGVPSQPPVVPLAPTDRSDG